VTWDRDLLGKPPHPRAQQIVLRPVGYRWRVSVLGEVWGPWTFAWTFGRAKRAAARFMLKETSR
jgi:hypothetical protein